MGKARSKQPVVVAAEQPIADADQWAAAAGARSVPCTVCRAPEAVAVLTESLEAMARTGAHRVTLSQLLARIVSLTSWRGGVDSLRRHLTGHQRALYMRATGRD